MADDISFPQRLQSALDECVREFNVSRDPSGAVAKVASDYGFTPSGTQRLLETFNRARTIFHFNTAEDKSAEFALAEPDKVIGLMYSDRSEPKSASVLEKAAYDGCYLHGETDYLQDPVFSAEIKSASETEPELSNISIENLQLRVQQERQRFKQAMEMAHDLGATARIYSDRDAEKIASTLIARGKDRDGVRALFGVYKEACSRDPLLAPVLPLVAERFSSAYGVSDLGSVKYASVLDTSSVDDLLDMTGEISQYMQKLALSEAVMEGIRKDSEEFEKLAGECMYSRADRMGKSAGADEDDFLLKRAVAPYSFSAEKPEGEKKEPKGKAESKPKFNLTPEGGLVDNISRGAASMISRATDWALDTDLYRVVSGADMERRNKELSQVAVNVRRQLMLQDLLTNDPVLSEADPQKVISAYQTLLETAPEVANEKQTTTSVLRQFIHGQDAVSPYDAEQLAKLNIALRTVRGMGSPVQKTEIRL